VSRIEVHAFLNRVKNDLKLIIINETEPPISITQVVAVDPALLAFVVYTEDGTVPSLPVEL
jgi:hypothetical protein